MAGEPLFEMEFGNMAGEDEDVIVSLPGNEGDVVVTKVGDGVVVKSGKAGADDPIDDLKGQFAAMTQRATAAERLVQQATDQAAQTAQRLQQVEGQVVSGQLDTVLSGLAAAEAEATGAEKDYTTAFEQGDGAAMARAQRKIAAAESRLQRLNEAKDDLEDAAKTRTTEQPRQQPQRRTADPVEQFAQGMSSRSAAWIRSHPECVTDQKQHARMLAAHNLALVDEVEVDSDEYFRRIEEGIQPAARSAARLAPAAGDGRRPSSAAAPATGGGGALNGGTEVRLTRGEALSATDGTLVWNYDDPTPAKRFTKGDPIGLAEMARRKHEGKKAGLYDKSVSE